MTAGRYAVREGDRFKCLDCGATVAHVRLSFGEEVVELDGSPVRKPRAEQEGVPYYEARRTYMGHRTRHADDRIEAERRQLGARLDASPDHRPIENGVFDTECPNCRRRVRVERDPKDDYGTGALV